MRPGTLIRSAAALSLLIAAAAAPAQDKKLSLTFEESNRFSDLREGKRTTLEPADAALVRKKAQIDVNLMLQSAQASSNSGEVPITDVVRRVGNDILDPNNPPRKFTVVQQQIVAAFGKEMVDQLTKILGSQAKPSKSDILLKVNAARMLSITAKSGCEELADMAVDLITDPNQSDAVKLYALEALGNLFAAPHPEFGPERSVFKNAERETKAIVTLIDFISRKPALDATSTKEEVDGFRYVRREAVRALGFVRKPIVRADDKVVATPGVWLLRFASADQGLSPPASLTERIEGLVGFLKLLPDKEMNMDFAAGFVALALRDLAQEYKESKVLEKPKADDKKPPDSPPQERDSIAWKRTATRLQMWLKGWKDSWDNPTLGPKRAEVQRMIAGLAKIADDNILNFLIEGNKRDQVILEPLNTWLQSAKFPSVTLFTEDKASTVSRPGADR